MEDIEEDSNELWMEVVSTSLKRSRYSNSEILLGGRKSDCRRELAKCILTYLENLVHLVLFCFGGYPRENFCTTRFGDLLVQRCMVPEVLDYVDRCFRTVFRWISFSKLKKFSIVIVDEDDVALVNYVVCIHSTTVSKYENDENFGKLISKLRHKFQRSILEIQCQAAPCNKFYKRRRLLLKVSLDEDTENLKNRSSEYVWLEDSKILPENTIEPCCSPVCSPLIKFTWKRVVYCSLRFVSEFAADRQKQKSGEVYLVFETMTRMVRQSIDLRGGRSLKMVLYNKYCDTRSFSSRFSNFLFSTTSSLSTSSDNSSTSMIVVREFERRVKDGLDVKGFWNETFFGTIGENFLVFAVSFVETVELAKMLFTWSQAHPESCGGNVNILVC
uniref:HORMA domain-containing protein n=1 Tax=Syphacia muris TaxID=451379 RepID=A0A158R4H3_9BILA